MREVKNINQALYKMIHNTIGITLFPMSFAHENKYNEIESFNASPFESTSKTIMYFINNFEVISLKCILLQKDCGRGYKH